MSRSLQIILSRMKSQGDRPAIVSFEKSGVRSVTFAELDQRVVCLAQGLRAEGVDKGQPIALFAPNSPEWVIAA